MKNKIFIVCLLASISIGTKAQTLQNITASLRILPTGVINISGNAGVTISAATLNSQFLVYPGNNKQIDVGSVVYYYGYNSKKQCYDGLATVLDDQEIVNGPDLPYANGNLQFDSKGDVICQTYTNTNP